MDADAARADVAEMMTSANQAWHVEARDQRRRIFERLVGASAVSDGGEGSTNE